MVLPHYNKAFLTTAQGSKNNRHLSEKIRTSISEKKELKYWSFQQDRTLQLMKATMQVQSSGSSIYFLVLRSLVDRCGSLGSCKLQIHFFQFLTNALQLPPSLSKTVTTFPPYLLIYLNVSPSRSYFYHSLSSSNKERDKLTLWLSFMHCIVEAASQLTKVANTAATIRITISRLAILKIIIWGNILIHFTIFNLIIVCTIHLI